jgi:hypothetical protein
MFAIGEYRSTLVPENLNKVVTVLDVDGLALWSDQKFIASLAASDIGVIVLGEAWLEEEIFIAALEAVKLGCDVRVLADLSIARLEVDRSLVLDRLALHGVLTMTVRQALLEWAMFLDDPVLRQSVQQLLS